MKAIIDNLLYDNNKATVICILKDWSHYHNCGLLHIKVIYRTKNNRYFLGSFIYEKRWIGEIEINKINFHLTKQEIVGTVNEEWVKQTLIINEMFEDYKKFFCEPITIEEG